MSQGSAGEELAPLPTICGIKLPDGSRCDEELETFTEDQFGVSYSAVKPCMKCKVVWNMHNAFGWLDESPQASKEMQSAIVSKLSVPVSKTSDSSIARDVLRDVVMGCGKKTSAILAGPTGTGKTFLSLHVLKTCIEKCAISGLYAPEHILVKAYKASHDYNNPKRKDWGERFLNAAKTFTLLVLDDFGQSRNMSEGCLDAIEQIIMYRYDAGLQVVVTTNRDVNGLAQERGHRMMSRLRGMTNDKFVVLDGDDWRASNAEA